MITIMPEEIQTTPKITSINSVDMISWWTKNGNGNFDWALYHQIIEVKKFLIENQS